MDWIKCSDRMPEDGEFVIVATGGTTWVETHFIEYDHYTKTDMWFSSNGEAEPKTLNYFTHWQLLPEPPNT